MEHVSVDQFSVSFSFDDMDQYRDLSHLIDLSIQKVEGNIGKCRCHFFVHHAAYHEYREVVKEGIFSISEDSLFLQYLAMHRSVISMEDISREIVVENDEILKFMLLEHLAVSYFVPIVRRYRLLGFLGLSFPGEAPGRGAPGPVRRLQKQELLFLDQLAESLHANLYAALQVDIRFHEYLALSEIASRLKEFGTYEELTRGVLDVIADLLPYDAGVFYEYDEFARRLVPCAAKNAPDAPILAEGESVSGYALRKRKALLCANVRENVHYASINREPFIDASFLAVPILSDKHSYGVLTLVERGEHHRFSRDHLYLLQIFASILVNEFANKMLYRQLEKSYLETIITLTKTLEAKDAYTRGHSERVMKYSVGIAQVLGCSADTITEIRYAAMLHDIGKIGVSDVIINKVSSLTDEEFGVIKKHTSIGAGIIDSVNFLRVTKDLIQYHHEKIDGTGYHGKKGGEYPWEAMIISIADIFDALTSNRPYRDATSAITAFRHIWKLRGINFEERLVLAFGEYLSAEGILPAGFLPDVADSTGIGDLIPDSAGERHIDRD